MRIAAGILTLLGALIGGTIWLTIVRELISGWIVSGGPYSEEAASNLATLVTPLVLLVGLSPLLVGGMGGVMALRREHYKWALAGAICSILFPFFGIPAVILLVKTRREFEQENENADTYYAEGNAYDETGEYAKAIADYNKAIELDPNHALAYFNRAYAYGEIGEYDRAIADYSKAIELDPRDAQAYYNRGVDYRNKGEVLKAVSDLEKCIELSTDPQLTEDARQTLNQMKNSR